MRVLGIDCGSQVTGYGLIESDGRRHHAPHSPGGHTCLDCLERRAALLAAPLHALT